MNTSPVPNQPQTPTKAVLAAVAAAVASLVAAVSGRPEIDNLNATAWVLIVCSAIVAGLVTYLVPNSPK